MFSRRMRSCRCSGETTEEEIVTKCLAKLNEYKQQLQSIAGWPEVKTALHPEGWRDHSFIMTASF